MQLLKDFLMLLTEGNHVMITLRGVHSCLLSWSNCSHSGGASVWGDLISRLPVASCVLDLFHKKPYSLEVYSGIQSNCQGGRF